MRITMQANFAARWSWCFRADAAFVFAALTLFFAPISRAQTTVNYTMQTGDMDRVSASPSGGIYNSGSTSIGMWMNGDNNTQGNAVWDTFRVGSASNTAARELQIGDEFTITVNTRGVYYGTVGVSLNDGNEFSNDSFTNRLDNSRLAVIQNGANFGSGTGGAGSWYVSGASTPNFANVPNGTATDYVIRVKITSGSTANITLGSSTLYDIGMNGSVGANIDSFYFCLS